MVRASWRLVVQRLTIAAFQATLWCRGRCGSLLEMQRSTIWWHIPWAFFVSDLKIRHWYWHRCVMMGVVRFVDPQVRIFSWLSPLEALWVLVSAGLCWNLWQRRVRCRLVSWRVSDLRACLSVWIKRGRCSSCKLFIALLVEVAGSWALAPSRWSRQPSLVRMVDDLRFFLIHALKPYLSGSSMDQPCLFGRPFRFHWNQDLLSQQRHIFCASEPALYAVQHIEVSGTEAKICSWK